MKKHKSKFDFVIISYRLCGFLKFLQEKRIYFVVCSITLPYRDSFCFSASWQPSLIVFNMADEARGKEFYRTLSKFLSDEELKEVKSLLRKVNWSTCVVFICPYVSRLHFTAKVTCFFYPYIPSPASLIYKMTWNPNPQVFVSRFILKIEIRIVNIVWASLTMECPWTYLQSPRYNQYSRLVHMVDVVDHKNCACHWVFLQNF